jgi:hypothetical protein
MSITIVVSKNRMTAIAYMQKQRIVEIDVKSFETFPAAARMLKAALEEHPRVGIRVTDYKNAIYLLSCLPEMGDIHIHYTEKQA